jgi:hypothetical protein
VIDSRIRLLTAVSFVCACAFGTVACVGDDTVVDGMTPPVQGGSGPPPSSYDATADGQGEPVEGGSDVVDASGGDASGGDGGSTDGAASDAATETGADGGLLDATAIDASDANPSADAADATGGG